MIDTLRESTEPSRRDEITEPAAPERVDCFAARAYRNDKYPSARVCGVDVAARRVNRFATQECTINRRDVSDVRSARKGIRINKRIEDAIRSSQKYNNAIA